MAQTVKKLLAIQEIRFYPWVRKIPLENAKAPHTSILAWRIPWKEESGRVSSTGLQRVRHNWTTNSSIFLFRSMIYFKLIIIYVVKYKSNFFLLNVDIQLSLHYLLKSLLMPHWTVLTTLSNTAIEVRDFLWTLDSIPRIYISSFLLIPYCLEYHNFVVILKWKASVLFFFKIVLATLGSLHLNINFKLELSIYEKR